MTGVFAPFLWDNLKKTGQKLALGRRNWLNSGLLLRPLPFMPFDMGFFQRFLDSSGELIGREQQPCSAEEEGTILRSFLDSYNYEMTQ